MEEFSSSPSLSSKYGVLNLQNSSRRSDIILSLFRSMAGPEGTGPDAIGPEGTGPDAIGPEETGPEVIGAEGTGPEVIGADANISKDEYVKNGKENAPLL
jgi:hypothetical protein